jgi:hypothetical protein
MSHAGTLRQLARRFSMKELDGLEPEARVKWLSMIRAHAQAFQKETAGLRLELEPIFFRSAGGRDFKDAAEMSSQTDLRGAAEQLFGLGAAQERVLRSAFTTSNRSAMPSVINGRQLWQSLRSAEKLALKIQSALPD